MNRVVQKNLRKTNMAKKNTSFKRRRTSGSKESFKSGLNCKNEVQLGRGDLEKIQTDFMNNVVNNMNFSLPITPHT